MLESIENLQLCGATTFPDGDGTPIYVNDNGEVIFEADGVGANYIEGIIVDKPIYMEDTEKLQYDLEEGKYGTGILGVIPQTDLTAIVILSETKAEVRSITDIKKPCPETAFAIRMDVEFEE